MMAEIKECNERAFQYESGNNPLTAFTPELVLHLVLHPPPVSLWSNCSIISIFGAKGL